MRRHQRNIWLIKKNVKKFAEEFNSIDITKTAQNSLAAGIVGTLTIIGAVKFAKKIPLIAKIPLAFFAFCGISMLTLSLIHI